MREIVNMGAQGDVLFRRVEAIPATVVERRRDGAIVVAHSETGHHHVLRSHSAKLFDTPSPHIKYLWLGEPYADVEHQRPFDTHETLRLLGPALFEVRRQREHKPERSPEIEARGPHANQGEPRPHPLPEALPLESWVMVAD